MPLCVNGTEPSSLRADKFHRCPYTAGWVCHVFRSPLSISHLTRSPTARDSLWYTVTILWLIGDFAGNLWVSTVCVHSHPNSWDTKGGFPAKFGVPELQHLNATLGPLALDSRVWARALGDTKISKWRLKNVSLFRIHPILEG